MPRYTRDESVALRKGGEQIAADSTSDPDFDDIPPDWYETSKTVLPAGKRLTSLRLDPAVLDWFRSQGPGYQTRINTVLANYVRHKQAQLKR